MSENLNGNLYKRFGLDLGKKKVESGFRKYMTNELWKALYSLHKPNDYKEEFRSQLWKAREIFLRVCCREIFLDYDDYTSDYDGISRFINDILGYKYSFEEVLVNIQIILNNLHKYDITSEDFQGFVIEIGKYSDDFPILGITIKTYKTKAPQILPSVSKFLDREITDTLGVLDVEKFKTVSNNFETGIKIFAKAKTLDQLKDVVEDMHASCDEIVKIVLGQKNKGFKNVTDKEDHKKLGLNGCQKEIFKNLKNLMDEIKHGSRSDFNRYDVEMIIGMVASFIRLVAVKYK